MHHYNCSTSAMNFKGMFSFFGKGNMKSTARIKHTKLFIHTTIYQHNIMESIKMKSTKHVSLSFVYR